MLQTSVEIVKPGGTGSPALVISARPDPLPPSRSFMCRLPSALPEPKKYTYFFGRAVAGFWFFVAGRRLLVAGFWLLALPLVRFVFLAMRFLSRLVVSSVRLKPDTT